MEEQGVNATVVSKEGENDVVLLVSYSPTDLDNVTANRSSEDEDEDKYEEDYIMSQLVQRRKPGKKRRCIAMIEFMTLECLIGFLIASLTVPTWENIVIWEFKLWEWCVVLMLIFCSRLIAELMVNSVCDVIERCFLLKNKFLRRIYELKYSFILLVWTSFSLVIWMVLVKNGAGKISNESKRIQDYITRALASLLIGAVLWLVKTLLVKRLASSFDAEIKLELIKDLLFYQYIVEVLSGPPLLIIETVKNTESRTRITNCNMLQGCAWIAKCLIKVMSGSWLSIDSIERSQDLEWLRDYITAEEEAKAVTNRIFRNVAKPQCRYMEKEDLLRFLPGFELDVVLSNTQGATETGQITKSSFKKWVVKVHDTRRSVAHSLTYIKITNHELNKIVSGAVLILIIIISLVVMRLLTSEVVTLIISQFILLAFMFGNTAKTVFESIIFVFVVHPFFIGDHCVVDGVEMVVSDISLLTTVFLKGGKEKIFYPNSALMAKPLSNFYSTPDTSDSLEFAIDVSTSPEKMEAMKDHLKRYLLSKPEYWLSTHKVIVKGIDDEKKMKIGLSVAHNINSKNSADKSDRRSELILELKKIFQDLRIKCLSIGY